MKKLFNTSKWFMLIAGIIIAILGVTMLFTPLESLITLAIFIGISMLISGISEIAAFFGEETGARSGWMLASGIISTLFGIWTMFGSGTAALVAVIPFIFAAWVMTSGISRIAGSIAIKNEGFGQWGLILAFGIIGTLLGFMLLFSPVLSAAVVAFSIAFLLLSHGINNIIIFFRMKSIGDRINRHTDQ